jgi:NIMA (never in mitosis gene a)-related kinase
MPDEGKEEEGKEEVQQQRPLPADLVPQLPADLGLDNGTMADYEVIKPIGKGKFSVVYRAKRIKDEQLVALKKVAIFDMMDEKARDKCLKEVKSRRTASLALHL